MGFGQYHDITTDLIARREAYGLGGQKRDSGYPVPRDEVESGRMNKADILAGVPDKDWIVSSKKTAHNEITRHMQDGRIICRFRETDIVTMHNNGNVTVNTGGWNTPSTRRHVMDFLSRHGFPVTIWGDKKAGGNLLRDLRGETAREIKFRERVTIYADGSWLAD